MGLMLVTGSREGRAKKWICRSVQLSSARVCTSEDVLTRLNE